MEDSEPTSKSLYWARRILTLLIAVALMVLMGVMVYEPSVQKQKDLTHLVAEEVIVDPDVIILTQYQKARNSKLPIELAELQATLIVQVAKAEGFPVELLVGIIEAETAPPFNPLSTSSVGATGLMQIFQAPNVTIDEERRYDIQYVLEIGCLILHGKLEKNNGNLSKALADYSGGAEGYAEEVFESIGRFVMFKHRSEEAGIKLVKR